MDTAELRAELIDKNPLIEKNGVVLALGEPDYEAEIDSRVQRAIDAASVTAAEETRKVWANARHFVDEFTMEELAAIGLSPNPIVAGFRVKLYTWRDEVWSDDPRVLGGLQACVVAGALTAERVAQILAKA